MRYEGCVESISTHMACKHVEQQVEGRPCPRRFHEHSCGVDDLGRQWEQTKETRNVLEKHYESERLLRV